MRSLIGVMALALLVSGCNETIAEGMRFTRDESERFAWKQWALKGDMEAQYKLGKLYCCGEKPKHHNGEALRWFCAAAKQGQRDAMLEVGKFYHGDYHYKGSSIPVDPLRALVWFRLAKDHHNAEAEEYITEITPTLDAESLKEVEELVRDFPYTSCRP
ncbi:MAG: sel1 repeat family protein [Rickettsiales bacterium]|nr:sel1 repeat family protein [Rickettsiales bacterium]